MDERERAFWLAEHWPLTIVADRYSGIYSGGAWTAWPCEPWAVPEAAHGGDVACAAFFAAPTLPYGIGATPEEARDDLIARLGRGR